MALGARWLLSTWSQVRFLPGAHTASGLTSSRRSCTALTGRWPPDLPVRTTGVRSWRVQGGAPQVISNAVAVLRAAAPEDRSASTPSRRTGSAGLLHRITSGPAARRCVACARLDTRVQLSAPTMISYDSGGGAHG